METPEKQPETDLQEGDRLSEEDIGREDGLNDAEDAGPESALPSD